MDGDEAVPRRNRLSSHDQIPQIGLAVPTKDRKCVLNRLK
jgi:hypothetical protein